MSFTATARAPANIAFIKYWGNDDDTLRLPSNPSLSMNLDGLYAETTVTWDMNQTQDQLTLNEAVQSGKPLERVQVHLDHLREALNWPYHAHVTSHNNFPMGAGIASSAAAFAALTLAAIKATGKTRSEKEISSLARLGSGSASRSIPDGFVEWRTGQTHEGSYAESIADADYWSLVDVIAIVSTRHKETGSTEGHQTAKTSPLQAARIADAQKRLSLCKEAILNRDFQAFADIVELDSNLMHAVMMTSRPPLMYWAPASLLIMNQVPRWRQEGINVCYTLDAGPNVHCICEAQAADLVQSRLQHIDGVVDIRVAKSGNGARVLTDR